MQHAALQDEVRPQLWAVLVVPEATGLRGMTVPMVVGVGPELKELRAAQVAMAVRAPRVRMDLNRVLMNMAYQVEREETEGMEVTEDLEAMAQLQVLVVVRDLELPVDLGATAGLGLWLGALSAPMVLTALRAPKEQMVRP